LQIISSHIELNYHHKQEKYEEVIQRLNHTLEVEDKENENTGSKNFGKGVTQKSERPKVTAEGLKKYFGGTN